MITKDIDNTNELIIFQETIRQFANERVKPIATKIDEEAHIPDDLINELKEMGMFGVPFPERYGGTGFGWRAYYIMAKELAKVDGSIPALIGAHTTIAANTLYVAGNEKQKETYLTRLAQGDAIGAFALTEQEAGSDAAGIKATAKKDRKEWILNGHKCFITNAPDADIFIVFAKTGIKDVAHGNMSAFIVERDQAGLTIGKAEKKMGIRGSKTSDVILEDVRIPEENLIGNEGEAFIYAMRAMQYGRLSIATQSLGLAKGAFELAVQYVKERKQFGRPLANFQMVQAKIAEMKMDLYAIECMLNDAIRMLEADEHYNLESSIVKAFASEKADAIINESLQLFGGYGYMMDYPLERMLRDARINRIYEGTSEIQRIVIAKEVLRQ